MQIEDINLRIYLLYEKEDLKRIQKVQKIGKLRKEKEKSFNYSESSNNQEKFSFVLKRVLDSKEH